MLRLRQILFLGAGLLSVLVLTVLFFYFKDYRGDFIARRGTGLVPFLEPAGGDSATQRSWLTLTNSEGFRIQYGLLVPRDTTRRYPAIVLLGGKATGKHAVDYVLGIPGLVIAAVDYPYEPRQKYSVTEFIGDIPAIRQALLDMVPGVMMVCDYFATLPYVDSTRIIMVGYSFGAPFVPTIVRTSRRPALAAMVYGGGDLGSLITHNVRRYESAPVGLFVGSIGHLLLRPLEPTRYAAEISPTPFLMINGTDDEMIPRENVLAVYEVAQEPKKLIWLDSRHVNRRNPELTKQIVAHLEREFRERSLLP